MEAVFGPVLLRQQLTSDDQPGTESVLVSDLAPCQYVTVLFTAEYCPPCQAFAAPFQEFVDTVNKDGLRMQVVVVNCDKRKEEFQEQMKRLSIKYLFVPFSEQEVQARLEDMAQAANLPRAAVFVTRKGFDSFAVKDIKRCVLKSASVQDAVTEVVQLCEQ